MSLAHCCILYKSWIRLDPSSVCGAGGVPSNSLRCHLNDHERNHAGVLTAPLMANTEEAEGGHILKSAFEIANFPGRTGCRRSISNRAVAQVQEHAAPFTISTSP